MLVTLAGIVTLVKESQYSNAYRPMLVTLPSVGITLSLHPTINVLLAVSIKQFPAAWYTGFPASTAMLSKEVHSRNAYDPMLVTLAGIVTLVKDLQWRNADDPMLVTLAGIVTLVKEVHQLNAPYPMLVNWGFAAIVTLVKDLQ